MPFDAVASPTMPRLKRIVQSNVRRGPRERTSYGRPDPALVSCQWRHLSRGEMGTKMRTTLSMSPTGDSPTAWWRVAALASGALLGACLIAEACLMPRMSPERGLPGGGASPSMALLAYIAALALAPVLGGLLLLAWKAHADAHRELRGLVERGDLERRRWTEQLVAMETQLQALRAPVVRLQVRCEGTPDAATLAALAIEGVEMRALIEALQACLQGQIGRAHV